MSASLEAGSGVSAARLSSFSDCVISIVITVMILNLKLPQGTGWRQVASVWPTAAAYCLSYIFVGVCWVNHHHLLTFVRRPVMSVLWTNLGFLFAMSFLPFSTAYLAQERMNSFSVLLYSISFMPVITSFMMLEIAIARSPHYRTAAAGVRRALLRDALALAIYAVAAIAAPFSAKLATLLIVAVTPLYLLPEKVHGPSGRAQG